LLKYIYIYIFIYLNRTHSSILVYLGHFSTVTLKFEQASDYTRVHVKQEGIPIGEVDAVRNNWQSYYWNPIKSVFGYGSKSSSLKSSSNPRKNKRDRNRKNNNQNSGGVGSSVFAVAIVLTAIVLGYVFLSRSSTT
jgi:hypothetical protein